MASTTGTVNGVGGVTPLTPSSDTAALASSDEDQEKDANKQEIYMEGVLLKRQRGLGHSSSKLKSLKFQQRYCQLTPTGLEYYEKKKDRKPRGMFPMDHIKIVEIVPSHSFGRNCCFQIGDDKEQMYFACQTYQERKQWTEALRKVALDCGNSMLSHYHWGAYGLEEKDKWSCCKSTDRMCQGCHPVGTVVKNSEGNAIGYEPDVQQKEEWQDSLQGSTISDAEVVSESKEGSFSFDEVASELQDAKSWLHLSVHIDSTLGETVSGDTKGESLLESLQLKTPACSKMLEPLVRSGLVTVADTAGDDVAVLPIPNEVSPQSEDATDLAVQEPTDQEDDGNMESDEEEQQESPPTLAELVNELQEVVDWFYLGLCLRVPMATLLNLRQDYRNVDTCRTEMLDAWMKMEKPAWSKLVTALKEMKLMALAKRLASKFCVDTDKENEVSSQEQYASDPEVVHLDMRYVDKDDQKLPGDLVRALKEVKSWYPLGLCLGIPMEQLQEIKSKRISAKKCARKVLLAWLEREVTSWGTLVRALNEVGATDLAYKIASKYDVPLAHQPGEEVPSTDSLRKPRTESNVTINAEHQSVSFRKDDDEFTPGWDFTIPEVDDPVFEDTSVAEAVQREERVDLKDVLGELREVTDWFYLGMCLGIPIAKLQAVKQDYKHTDERKREVFLKWMEMEEPTWSKIVRVLREMGKKALANQIAQNHGLSVSDLDEPVEQMAEPDQGVEGGSSLLTDVHESKPSLKDLLRELQEVTEWQPFGRHLGLEEPELEAIYEDNQTTEDSRREMIMLWMERDPECSWQKIVNALVQMEALPLAAQIAHKYGVPLPQEVIDYVAEEQLQGTAEEVQEDIPCPEGLHTQMEGVAMKDLLIELQEVTDWLYLGVCLGVPESKLKEIRCDYEDVEDRKREMLSSWMEKEIPTWSKVIKALAEIGMHKLAIAIASKYGEPVPSSLQEALERLERDVAEGQDVKQDDNDAMGENNSTQEPDQDTEEQEEEEMIVPAYEDQGEVKLKDLVNELKDVVDWFTFGCYLGLGTAALQTVKRDRGDVDSCRREMLSVWMREYEPTWYKVVAALVEMKMYNLAVTIASKYKVRVSKKMVDAMRGEIPEGELKVLEVEEVEESDTDSESSSDEEEEAVEMREILQELEEVTDWYYLGLCLGVEEPRLKAIRKDNKGNENRKRAMLFAWSKLQVPTWRKVVRALLEMGERVLAEKIAEQYGIPLPKFKERPRPEEEDEEEEEEEPEHSLPKVYGFDMMDAFWNGNVIQLIAESNGYPIQVKEATIRGYGPFSGSQSHFTVLTPRGAPRGEIMLQNVFWQGSYLAIHGRVYIVTAEGPACHLRVHIGPNNLVCFESVSAPGQYLGMYNNGAVCKPQKVTPDQVEAKFFVRVQRQMYQYLTTIMTEFGRPSVANLLQDECIVQLYLKPINAFLGINKPGQIITTPYSSNCETHFKIKDSGNGIYSLSSTCYRGRCIRIKDNILHGKGELSLDANFYLRENLDGTVSFESVTCPKAFISVADGTRLLKDFSLFSVKVEHPRKNLVSVTRTPLT